MTCVEHSVPFSDFLALIGWGDTSASPLPHPDNNTHSNIINTLSTLYTTTEGCMLKPSPGHFFLQISDNHHVESVYITTVVVLVTHVLDNV